MIPTLVPAILIRMKGKPTLLHFLKEREAMKDTTGNKARGFLYET